MLVVCIDGDWTLGGRPIRGPELGLVYEVTDIAYHRDDPDLLMVQVDGLQLWYEMRAFRPATDADCPLRHMLEKA